MMGHSHVTLYCFFLCSMSFFLRILLLYVTFDNILYICIYIIIIFIRLWCRSSCSIKFRFRVQFCVQFFLSRLTSESTTFKVAMSHFVFYPCGALHLRSLAWSHEAQTNVLTRDYLSLLCSLWRRCVFVGPYTSWSIVSKERSLCLI